MIIRSGRHVAACLAAAALLQACGGGGDGAPPARAADVVITPDDNTLPSGRESTLEGDSIAISTTLAWVLRLKNSLAVVSVPAMGLIDATTGAPASGMATVTIKAILPSADPKSKSLGTGQYEYIDPLTSATLLLEGFGVLQIDAVLDGKPLQLAPGKTSVIRIPNLSPTTGPDTLALYHWSEIDSRWVRDGTAQRKGNDAQGYYYEATVTRFGIWNVAAPATSSI